MSPQVSCDQRQSSAPNDAVTPSIKHDHSSPIYRLSPELLTHVFELADASFRNDFAPFVSAPATCALSFSRVCKNWQLVAKQTHQLWTSITIQSDGDLIHATKWTNRAGSRLLDIDLLIRTKGGGCASTTGYKFLQSHFARLRRLSLDMRDDLATVLPFSWPKGPTELRSLRLIKTRLSFRDICFLLGSSPLLEDLHIATGPWPHDLRDRPPFLAAAYDEVTPHPTRLKRLFLDMPYIRAPELCEVLDLCSNLEFLSLILPRSFGKSFTPLPRLQMRSLRVASLPFGAFTERLLHYWHAPLLRSTILGQRLPCSELYVDFTYGTASRETYCSIDFMDDDSLLPEDLLFFLRCNPQIEFLTISNCEKNLVNALMYICCPDSTGKFGLPRLRSFEIANCPWWNGDLMWFEYRYWADTARPRPLEYVSIRSCPALVGAQDVRRLFTHFGTYFFYREDESQLEAELPPEE